MMAWDGVQRIATDRNSRLATWFQRMGILCLCVVAGFFSGCGGGDDSTPPAVNLVGAWTAQTDQINFTMQVTSMNGHTISGTALIDGKQRSLQGDMEGYRWDANIQDGVNYISFRVNLSLDGQMGSGNYESSISGLAPVRGPITVNRITPSGSE